MAKRGLSGLDDPIDGPDSQVRGVIQEPDKPPDMLDSMSVTYRAVSSMNCPKCRDVFRICAKCSKKFYNQAKCDCGCTEYVNHETNVPTVTYKTAGPIAYVKCSDPTCNFRMTVNRPEFRSWTPRRDEDGNDIAAARSQV